MRFNKNQTITLTIEDVNNLGFGVSHVDGFTIFVSDAIDGEIVLGKIILVKTTFAIAKVEEYIQTSPNRIEPYCKVKGCGGCAYQSMSYEHELELKKRYVQNCFHKVGLNEIEVQPTQTVKDEKGKSVIWHYRNKAQYPVSQDEKGKYIIGFYASKTHRVIPCMDCPLQDSSFEAIIQTLKSFFEENHIPAYNEESKKDLVRHLYFRVSHKTKEVLLTIVVNGKTLPKEKELVSILTQKHPNIKGILINTNTKDTNVICGDEYRTLYGTPYIDDELCNVKLQITAPSFYQVNHDAAELLYNKAIEIGKYSKEDVLLDLFCGVGSIGLSMAHSVKTLIGIEIEPSAIECAKENAKKSQIDNAIFICGDATKTKELLKENKVEEQPTICVVDPPRKGLTGELIDYLCSLNFERIVYISCNPETLARDIQYFGARYRANVAYPFDLFPRTGHVETVVLLSRAN